MDASVSTAAIEVLIQNLINVFKEEYFRIRDLDEDAKQLQTTLRMIQGYLIDAENKSISQEAVKIWLRELQALSFDADNVLDELSYHLLHKKLKKTKTPKHKVLSCFSSFNHFLRPRNIAHTIEQINKNFEKMNKSATELGLQSLIVNAPPAFHASFETDSFTVDPIFIGRDDDVPQLVDVLCEGAKKNRIFSIITIVGMGGMGKTTLTRKIFTHQKMKNRFGSLIWVHVSQNFDPIVLFMKILSSLTSGVTNGGVNESREVILKNLQQALEAKTYLLVLDDVWNEDLFKWEDFMNSLSGVTSTKGNGIIISTRSTEVASIVRPLHIHPLKGLSEEDCWSIIKAKAFENGDDVVVPLGFEMIGRKIAKRCHGLPLAANVVGGVLRLKSEREWYSINENWLADVKGGENISKILKLSFDSLSSPSLKKCFAYCSIFRKGEEMEKQKLIELWMAEGFLQADGSHEMESVGDNYFNVLLHNSLLQAARDVYGPVRRYGMHDLVHDLATSISVSDSNGLNQARYMIVHEDKLNPIPKESSKYIRTLLFEGKISGTIFSDFESLHVLTLTISGAEELPNSIRKLIHLRNLNILSTEIRNLPDWIGELHHLQTLSAYNVKKLPSTFKYLINLRHLYVYHDIELPAEIGRLTCLRTLPHFTVGDKSGYQIEELGSLKNLKGKLEIRNLEKVRDKEDALKANMFQKANLIDLGFKWDEGRSSETNDESVLEGLQPHTNLKTLRIAGFKGKRFPLWTEKMAVQDGPQEYWVGLNELIEIRLSMCQDCEEIPMLEHLPNLKYLYLQGLKKVRYINSTFSKLTSLTIYALEELECLPNWLFRNNHNLSKLVINNCPKLNELPDGLHTLNSLEELYIISCPNLRSIGNPPSVGGGGQSQGSLLRKLMIVGCVELTELPCEMVEWWAPSLQTISLVYLSSLMNLPKVFDCLAKSAGLKELVIDGVPKLMSSCCVESWPFDSLWHLKMDLSKEWSKESSVAIKETVEGILQGGCHSLTELKLRGLENWEWLPASIQRLTNLSFLTLEYFGVEELPEWFGNLTSLTMLWLRSCKKLRRLPSGNASERLTKLHILTVEDCPELHIDSEWRHIPHLKIKVDGSLI